MILDKIWSLAKEFVFPVASSNGLFNPYRDRVDGYDVEHAVHLRRANFRNYLSCFEALPRVFLLAEAPGPWGCRFSGIPLVSEAQLVDESFPIFGQPTSTQETPHSEYSAAIYWRVLAPYFPHFFTWNSVPYHPYKPGNLLSIRSPTNREVAAYGDVLGAMLAALSPECVLAVGRKAEYALAQIGVESTYIRHPSQGGAKKFEEGVTAVFQALEL